MRQDNTLSRTISLKWYSCFNCVLQLDMIFTSSADWHLLDAHCAGSGKCEIHMYLGIK